MIRTVVIALVAAIIVICLALAARAQQITNSSSQSPASVEVWSPAFYR